jgi:hypothetical protein
MKESEISFEGSGETITKIRVGTVEIPCNAQLKDWSAIKASLESLVERGVFILRESSKVFKELAKILVDSERKVIKQLPIEGWISKSDLDLAVGLKGRELAGVLANITRKARKLGLVSKPERIHDQKWENDENHYKLKPEFEELKNMI